MLIAEIRKIQIIPTKWPFEAQWLDYRCQLFELFRMIFNFPNILYFSAEIHQLNGDFQSFIEVPVIEDILEIHLCDMVKIR
jgi:hypothetical protein